MRQSARALDTLKIFFYCFHDRQVGHKDCPGYEVRSVSYQSVLTRFLCALHSSNLAIPAHARAGQKRAGDMDVMGIPRGSSPRLYRLQLACTTKHRRFQSEHIGGKLELIRSVS